MPIVRLLPGVLGDEQSAADDSFSGGLLEAPQYTRPAEFRGWKVPDVLLSGHHAEIAAWRRREAERRTRENRPDLIRTPHRDPGRPPAPGGSPTNTQNKKKHTENCVKSWPRICIPAAT